MAWKICKDSGSLAPKLDRGFHQARRDLEPTHAFIVYPGTGRYPLDRDTEVIGLFESRPHTADGLISCARRARPRARRALVTSEILAAKVVVG